MKISIPVAIVLAVIVTSSCQKEISIEFPPTRIDSTADSTTTDSLLAFVMNGNYGFQGAGSYDSAVVQYGMNYTLIRHYDAFGTELLKEEIRYDDEHRVSAYFIYYPQEPQSYTHRWFTYNTLDSLPIKIIDSTNESGDLYTATMTLSNPVPDNGNTRYSLDNILTEPDPQYNQQYNSSVWVDGQKRLTGYSHASADYRSFYFYNDVAGYTDSCFTTTSTSDDSYAAFLFGSDSSELGTAIQLLYRNLHKYQPVAELNNSYFEFLLSISWWPAEISARLELVSSKHGYSASQLETKADFEYFRINNQLQFIRATHTHIFTGSTDETLITLYWK